MKRSGPNRRESDRHPVELRASLGDLDSTLSVTILNVSQGGVFVRTENPPDCWNNVELEIDIPGIDRTIQASGVVVWTVPPSQARPKEGLFAGAGIQFLEIKEADLALLRQQIQTA